MSFSDINIQGKFEPLARTPWVTLSLGWTIKCIIFYCMITHPGEVIILHFINLNSGISISVYYKQNESNQ